MRHKGAGQAARRLEDFLGRWTVERVITPAEGPDARFEGTAEWTRAEGGATYAESGKLLILGQPPMQAERRYFWHDDLGVDFDDGRFFHRVPPEGGETEHHCAPDLYRVRYDFTGWPQFDVTWRVTGPRKDYLMRSSYRPLD